MDPISYQTGGVSPFQSLVQGYQAGAGIRDDQQQQQQLQIAQQQAQQLAAARQAVIQNPTATNYANLMVLDPKAAEATQRAWSTRSTDQQQALSADLGQWGSALINNQPQMVVDSLNSRADALEAQAGAKTPQSESMRALAQVVQNHPDVALGKILALADANPNGKQVADGLRLQLTQNATTTKANADAVSATAKAQVDAATVGDQVAAAGLKNAQTQQEIDASKLQGRIAELNTQIAQANSETQRGQLMLERDKLVAQQAQQKQQQGQQVQDSLDSSSQALQTIKDIRNHPGFDGFWTGPGTKWGAIWGKVPGTDRQALNNWVDSLRGQLGFDALMKAKAASPTGASGFGALSEGELKLISSLAAKLDPNANDFPAQLNTIQRYLEKAQSKAVSNPMAPTSGGAVVLTSPKYGAVRESDITRVMQQNPGATREQVIQFLQQQGQQSIPTR